MENLNRIEEVPCEDIMIILKDLRLIDDKIIYQLNLATPTASFRSAVDPSTKCKDLYEQLETTYTSRGRLINRCLSEFKGSVGALAELSSKNGDNNKIKKNLRNEQSKVRELKNELVIEEIIRERSYKAFIEKCKLFFNPKSSHQ